MGENGETIVEKTSNNGWTDPVTGKFVKGNPGGGRPNGSLDFKTKWHIFIDKVAKQNDMTPEQIDEQLLAVGFKKAKEGDYSFYRDIHDRVYGKPMQPTDITSKGERVLVMPPELINKNETDTSPEPHSEGQTQI